MLQLSRLGGLQHPDIDHEFIDEVYITCILVLGDDDPVLKL
jgi:hypothetical protein